MHIQDMSVRMRNQTIVICAVLVLTACAESSPPDVLVLDEDELALDMAGAPDISKLDLSDEPSEGPEMDMDVATDMGPPAHLERDWIKTSDFEQLEFEPGVAEGWGEREVPCTSDVETAVLEDEFFLPEPDPARPEAPNPAEFEAIAGIGTPYHLGGVFLDPDTRYLPLLQQGPPSHAFVREGEDLVFHLYHGALGGWSAPKLVLVTVMVNARPVEATFRR